ncbi:hypothetical protein PVAP13_9KG283026 [Panicum virgatum]|uniref:Uncharacterized protein n=1 Tax=Panicum virgatum TaxID=38727 RepID=A0A8T0NYC8_PANVG|nr:hypothetical protein PVAP13_9KG283026 [Panicum virgatum]
MTRIPSELRLPASGSFQSAGSSLAFFAAVAATIQGFRSKAQSFGRFDLICCPMLPWETWDPGAALHGATSRRRDETRRGLVVGLDPGGVFLAGSEITARTGQNWRRLLMSPRFGLASMCT